jgi:D-alanyl-D-alanine carboxypeptidase
MKLGTLFGCLALGFSAIGHVTAGPGTESIPSPAKAEFERFLAAFNAGDREVFTAYVRGHASASFGEESAITRSLGMFKAWGGLDLIEVIDSDPHSVSGWVRARDADDVMRIEFEIEPQPPHRLKTFALPDGAPPPAYLPARTDAASAAAAWRIDAAKRAAADKFSGAILFLDDGKVLARDAFGHADRGRKIPNTVETRFRTASVTKMFTAVAVLRLVQDGRIDLDDPLGKHVPELANLPLGRGTVHQYLNHTAGAGDLDHRWSDHQRELRSHDDYLRVFASDPLIAEPGQGHAYSNLGYMMLGSLIERVTGKDYYRFVRKSVFAPARMTRTGTEPEDTLVEGRSRVYEKPLGTHDIVDATERLDYRPVSAAGVYTTVDDVARFFAALRGRRLLDAKHTGLMMTPTTAPHYGRTYAYGLQSREGPEGHWLGHDGVDRGMNAEAWFSPQNGRVLVVLSNFDVPAAEQVANHLKARLTSVRRLGVVRPDR